MDKKKVLLTQLWSGHAAGEIIEEDAPCADSMVRKGYGVPYEESKKIKPAKPRETGVGAKGPHVETADAIRMTETADVRPQVVGKRGD